MLQDTEKVIGSLTLVRSLGERYPYAIDWHSTHHNNLKSARIQLICSASLVERKEYLSLALSFYFSYRKIIHLNFTDSISKKEKKKKTLAGKGVPTSRD